MYVPVSIKPSSIRFRMEDALSRRAFGEKLVNAERLPDGGLIVALRGGVQLRDGDLALAASIADDPAFVVAIVGETKLGVPALIAFPRDGDPIAHELRLSSLCGSSTMAEGAALSSAAPEARAI